MTTMGVAPDPYPSGRVSRRIVLLGGTGYLGSRLAARFVHDGHCVAVVKRRSSCMAPLADVAGDLRVFDLEDDGVDCAFAALGSVDVAVHTVAAYGRRGESGPEMLEANVAAPLRLLRAAIESGTPLFLSSGTSLRADVSEYALAKEQFRAWGRLLGDSRTTRFVNMRIEHFYGPGDDEVKFVTSVVRAFLRNVPSYEFTSGLQWRDFVYITDVVSAFRTVVENAHQLVDGFTELSVGSGESVTIRRFVQLLKELSGSATEPVFGALPDRRNEMMHTDADPCRLMALGWSPAVSLATGLRDMLEAERALLGVPTGCQRAIRHVVAAPMIHDGKSRDLRTDQEVSRWSR